MESIGEKLKKIRLEKGLSLEDVYKKTKIHINILEALEEGRLINKSPVYIRGFLKIYCEFLGVDPKDFIPDFKKPQVSTDYFKSYQKPILPKSSIKLSMFRSHFKIIRTLAIVVLLFILGSGVVKLTKAYKNKRYSAVTALSKKVKSNLPVMQKQIPLETIRLSIRARENCWIKAKVDDKVVFADVLKKGRFESWQAKGKIELSLGNAGGIELQLNDKLISSLGRKGQVIKHIVITKEEGLKIIR